MELKTRKYLRIHHSRHHNHIAISSGKVYIYDNSGTNPDYCDDGPLYVRTDVLEKEGKIIVESPMQRGDWISAYGPCVNIPVTSERNGEHYEAGISLEGAIVLGRRLSLPVVLQTIVSQPKYK